MTRNELNHFEQNISFALLGDKSLGEKFRFGFNVGGNAMYQKYELLGVTGQNMLDKEQLDFQHR